MIAKVAPDVVATWTEAEQRAYYEAVIADHAAEREPLWYTRPDLWALDNLVGIELTPYQLRFLRALDTKKRGALRGPRGLGKTLLAAVLVLWFVDTRERAGVDWKIGTTSGSWGQLSHYLWPEIHKINRHCRNPRADTALLTLSIKGGFGEAFAASPQQPDLIEGIHADSVLVLFDEAKIIKPTVFDSIEGAAMNAESQETFMLAMSTPGAPVGRFYDIHAGKPGFEDWHVERVTLEETIEAGRASQEEVDRLARMWGTGSAMYRQHVLGEFAADDEDSLIPYSWVELAVQRWKVWDDAGRPPQEAATVSGLDVARHGRDKTVLATVYGDYVDELWREAFTDNVSELADRLVPRLASHARTTVDGDGLGAGTADRLRTLRGDDRVQVFQGGHKAEGWTDATGELEAFNVRSAAWWSLRDRLNPAREGGATLAIPPDDRLIGDLIAPRLSYDPAGRIRIEKKDATANRLNRSPDDGDAVVMALWVAPRVQGDEYALLNRPTTSLSPEASALMPPQHRTAPPRSMGYGA